MQILIQQWYTNLWQNEGKCKFAWKGGKRKQTENSSTIITTWQHNKFRNKMKLSERDSTSFFQTSMKQLICMRTRDELLPNYNRVHNIFTSYLLKRINTRWKKKKKTANILRSVPCIARKHQGISFIIKTRHTSQSVEIGGRNRKEKRV